VTIHFATWALGVEFGVSRVEPFDWGYPLQRHCATMTIAMNLIMTIERAGISSSIMLSGPLALWVVTCELQ
jgi:hypothetical protein